jgi:hypothetical protein
VTIRLTLGTFEPYQSLCELKRKKMQHSEFLNFLIAIPCNRKVNEYSNMAIIVARKRVSFQTVEVFGCLLCLHTVISWAFTWRSLDPPEQSHIHRNCLKVPHSSHYQCLY